MLRQLLLSIVGFNFIALVYIMWKFFTDDKELQGTIKEQQILGLTTLINKHAEMIQANNEYLENLEKAIKDINKNVDSNRETIQHLIKTTEGDCDILEGIDKRIEKLEQAKLEQAKLEQPKETKKKK